MHTHSYTKVFDPENDCLPPPDDIILVLTDFALKLFVFERRKKLSFMAPGVPFLPSLAMFFNIYLMLKLPGLTWARLGIWICIGEYNLGRKVLRRIAET